MAFTARDDVLATRQARPAIDVTKIVIWVAAGILPWAALFLAARLVVTALG
jgi:hypothetical protein